MWTRKIKKVIIMCLSIPCQVVEVLAEDRVVVNSGNVKLEISIFLLAETVNVGDYLVVHAGSAISKLDEEEALETLELINEFLASKEAN